MLSKKQLADQCLAYDNSHRKCRYCSQDDDDWTKYYCLKKSGQRDDIDVDVDNFIKETRKKGNDPYKENVPLGDNCQGYPIMKHIEQGYDIK